MSRTDKDRPWWVRADDPLDRYVGYHPSGTAPRWYRRARWWGPQRRVSRVVGRRLANEHNTFGEVNDERAPAGEHHRHRAEWTWF